MIFPLGGKKKDNYSNGFKDNLTKLKDVGGSYFGKDNLPSEVGDSIKVSLKDLINDKKIDTLKVGKTTCNENDSYIKGNSSKHENNVKKKKEDRNKELLEEYVEKRIQARKDMQEFRTKEYFKNKEQNAELSRKALAAKAYEQQILEEH